MSQYVEHLKKLRDAVVDERRRVAANGIDLAIANNKPINADWAADVKRLQELIEAVDRAIADETRLMGPGSMLA
jgi:hypothetical protein